MARPLAVTVLSNEYVVLDAPEPLTDDRGERLVAFIDHEQRVIWIDAGVAPRRRLQVTLRALSLAWQERLNGAPLVQ